MSAVTGRERAAQGRLALLPGNGALSVQEGKSIPQVAKALDVTESRADWPGTRR